MSKLPPDDDIRKLTDELTRQKSVEQLQEHIGLDIAGTKATTKIVFDVLLHAASTGQSIEASCEELVNHLRNSDKIREIVRLSHANRAIKKEAQALSKLYRNKY